eukprot:3909839-Amphidinium_carterae.1
MAGCSKKQRDCPHGGKHACSQTLPDGTTCGNWQHNAITCPHNPQRRSKQPKSNGKGRQAQSPAAKQHKSR